MASYFDTLDDSHIDFIMAQPMFFTATACTDGRINLSPKGGDGLFQVIDASTFCYLDLTGSGNETAAHLKHDGRITIMFNSFTRTTRIMRLFGRGRVARPGSADFETHIGKFPEKTGMRQLIFVDIETVQTSCGYSIPVMDFVEHRKTADKFAENLGREKILEYQQVGNLTSIDGFDTGLND